MITKDKVFIINSNHKRVDCTISVSTIIKVAHHDLIHTTKQMTMNAKLSKTLHSNIAETCVFTY